MFADYPKLLKTGILTALAVYAFSGSFAWAQGKGRPFSPPPPQVKKTTTTTVPFTTLPTSGVVKQPAKVTLPASVFNPPTLIPKIPTTPPVVLPGPAPAPTNPPPKQRVVLEILRELVRLRLAAQGHGQVVVVHPPAQGGEPVKTGEPAKGNDPPATDPDEQPPSKTDPDESPKESAALTIGDPDIELLEVRFVSPGDAKQGPAYRVRIRNNSKADVTKAFTVILTASLSREPSKDSPQASAKVQSMKAGEAVAVDIRLPLAALRMGKNSEGKAVPFAYLFALVDGEDVLRDRTPENNLTIMARGDIAVIEE